MATDRRPRDTAAREARGIAIDLLRWEMGSGQGERYETACDKYGPDAIDAALEAIVNDLQRKGANR